MKRRYRSPLIDDACPTRLNPDWPVSAFEALGAASTRHPTSAAPPLTSSLTQCTASRGWQHGIESSAVRPVRSPAAIPVGARLMRALVTRQPHETHLRCGQHLRGRSASPARPHSTAPAAAIHDALRRAAPSYAYGDPAGIRVAEWPRRPASSRSPQRGSKTARRCARRQQRELYGASGWSTTMTPVRILPWWHRASGDRLVSRPDLARLIDPHVAQAQPQRLRSSSCAWTRRARGVAVGVSPTHVALPRRTRAAWRRAGGGIVVASVVGFPLRAQLHRQAYEAAGRGRFGATKSTWSSTSSWPSKAKAALEPTSPRSGSGCRCLFVLKSSSRARCRSRRILSAFRPLKLPARLRQDPPPFQPQRRRQRRSGAPDGRDGRRRSA